MSSENPTPPGGHDPVQFDNGDNDRDVDEVDLEPGDELHGTVVDIYENENQFGPNWRLRIMLKDDDELVDYWTEGDARKAARNDMISEGDEIWVAKMVDETTFYDDEEETEKSYFPTKFTNLEDSS